LVHGSSWVVRGLPTFTFGVSRSFSDNEPPITCNERFGSVNRTSEPGLGANECEPSGLWRKSTALRHCLVDC